MEGGLQTVDPGPPAVRRHTREYVAWMLAAVATLFSTRRSRELYLRAPRRRDAIVRFNVPPPLGLVPRRYD